MAKKHRPRKGSLQFWPRKKAKRIYPRIRNKILPKHNKASGFAGYKVGMLHLMIEDTKKTSLTKGMRISEPATLIECPPLKVASIRIYKKSYFRLKLHTEIFSKVDKELYKKIIQPKKKSSPTSSEQKITEIENNIDKYKEIRINAYTQPKLTGIGKKKPELFELKIGGISTKEQLQYAKEILGKEIKISDLFNEGDQLDVYGITKGKGLQGPIRRMGIKLKAHKSKRNRRNPGNIGPYTGNKTWRVPQAGQTGYHQRTEKNKLIMKISENPQELTKKGGFKNYGNLKNSYLIIKGSVQGPTKRMLRLEPAQKPKKNQLNYKPEIKKVIV